MEERILYHFRTQVWGRLFSVFRFVCSSCFASFGTCYFLGDPILFHAVYIIRCIDNPREVLNSSELVAFARLGTSVKKKAVLASVNAEQSVNYVTMKWMDA